jgi:hypothetical protein
MDPARLAVCRRVLAWGRLDSAPPCRSQRIRDYAREMRPILAADDMANHSLGYAELLSDNRLRIGERSVETPHLKNLSSGQFMASMYFAPHRAVTNPKATSVPSLGDAIQPIQASIAGEQMVGPHASRCVACMAYHLRQRFARVRELPREAMRPHGACGDTEDAVPVLVCAAGPEPALLSNSHEAEETVRVRRSHAGNNISLVLAPRRAEAWCA